MIDDDDVGAGPSVKRGKKSHIFLIFRLHAVQPCGMLWVERWGSGGQDDDCQRTDSRTRQA